MYLDKEKFQEFLKSQEQASKYVGYACSPCNCPLAMFLKFQGCWGGVEITENTYSTCEEDGELPAWAAAFVQAIDDWAEGAEIGIPSGIALEFLDSQ